MVMTVVLNMVLLPKFGGTYNQDFLSAAVRVCMLVAAAGIVLVCIGISEYDKPEYYLGIRKQEPLKMKDMLEVLKENKPLQAYIAAQASDKIAQQTAAQANSWTCECGASNTGKFCSECGKPAPAPANSWTCECGTVNTGKFCSECGKPAPAAEWTCECGTVNKGKFCSNCGKARS